MDTTHAPSWTRASDEANTSEHSSIHKLTPSTRARAPRIREWIDRDRNAWFRQEIYAYPLFICTRPEVLQFGTMSATADQPNEPLET